METEISVLSTCPWSVYEIQPALTQTARLSMSLLLAMHHQICSCLGACCFILECSFPTEVCDLCSIATSVIPSYLAAAEMPVWL